jgi:hypothetical protein
MYNSWRAGKLKKAAPKFAFETAFVVDVRY